MSVYMVVRANHGESGGGALSLTVLGQFGSLRHASVLQDELIECGQGGGVYVVLIVA